MTKNSSICRAKRGRPSKINRERVIKTALEIIKKSPDRTISMAMVAKELGIVTMGLYKHVKNKDEMLEGVAELVFSELDLSIDVNLKPDVRFHLFANRMREFFLANPFAISLISWHTHMSRDIFIWSAELVVILKDYGLRDKKLANTLEWLIRQLLAYISLESGEYADANVINRQNTLDGIPAKNRKQLEPLFPYLKETTNEELYQMHIHHTLAAIKLAAPKNLN